MSRISNRSGTKSRALSFKSGPGGQALKFGSWRGRPYGKAVKKVGSTKRTGCNKLK